MAVKREREPHLDIVKFVAMLAIVLLHVRVYAPLPDYGFVSGFDNFLTAFVLSLFVLVSGYFSRGLIFAGDFRKLTNRLVGILWPVMTLIVLFGELVSRAIYGKWGVHPEGWAHYILSAGWFFFCLAICLVLTFAAQMISRGRKGLLFLLLGAVFIGLWTLPVGCCHAKDMIVYFWFGVYAYPAYSRWKRCRAFGWTALALTLAASVVLPDFRSIRFTIGHDAVMPQGTFTWMGCVLSAVKYTLGLLSPLGVMELVRTVTKWTKGAPILARLGTQTMGVFFFHIQILSIYFAFVGWSGWGFAGRFLVACAAFAVAHGLSVLTRMNPAVSAILWNPLGLLGKRKQEVR